MIAGSLVNVQFFQRRVQRHQDPQAIADPTARTIAIENSILDEQRDHTNNGITLRISNKWFNDTLEAELFAVTDFTRDNSFIRPLLTYTFSDRWKGTIGAELYRGAEDTHSASSVTPRAERISNYWDCPWPANASNRIFWPVAHRCCGIFSTSG